MCTRRSLTTWHLPHRPITSRTLTHASSTASCVIMKPRTRQEPPCPQLIEQRRPQGQGLFRAPRARAVHAKPRSGSRKHAQQRARHPARPHRRRCQAGLSWLPPMSAGHCQRARFGRPACAAAAPCAWPGLELIPLLLLLPLHPKLLLLLPQRIKQPAAGKTLCSPRPGCPRASAAQARRASSGSCPGPCGHSSPGPPSRPPPW